MGSFTVFSFVQSMFIPKVIPKATFAVFKVISVQEACAKCFSVHVSKFEILQISWNKWNKEHQALSFSFSQIDLAFGYFLCCCFMWFAEFQILISKPKSIWRKLLVLSWLRDHSIITSSKRWVGGVKKWQFLMIYSTVNHQTVGWVGLKDQKHDDVILEWSLRRLQWKETTLCYRHLIRPSLVPP